jgi:hypothetical protein
VKAPPIKGPAIVAIPNIPINVLVYSALFSRGMVIEMMTKALETNPAAPQPATARATMKKLELVATLQSNDPRKKIARNTR